MELFHIKKYGKELNLFFQFRVLTTGGITPGITGVVLGGSWARGTNHPDSDIDIGIYYDSKLGFDPSTLNPIATMLDEIRRHLIIHGNMSSGVHFLLLVKRLPPDFKANLVDLWGGGDSAYNS